MRIKKPSPALVISVLALVVAATGVAGALPGRNRVTSDDIKNGNVISADIKNNGVLGKDVEDLRFERLPLLSGYTLAPGQAIPGYAKDAQGIVHFRGGATQLSSAGGVMAKLPSGLRPAQQLVLDAKCVGITGADALISIGTNGDMDPSVTDGSGANLCEDTGFVNLEGLSFYPGP